MSSPSGSKRIAVITGASSGIGRTSAIALARTNQWKICLSGRREEELEKTSKLCREARDEAQGGQGQQGDDLTLIVAGDVSKEDNVERLFSRVKEVYGKSVTAPSLPETFHLYFSALIPY
jgi:NAD(P)-dependent dehydrogenase (short-subunit alcohol dehydrogenase family)